jgi:threonine/homoserine/homoserine lactone efflux protein
MGAVIGDLLPLGLSVAISPIPIAAVILMLLSGQAARTSTGFLAGWVAGIVVVTVVVLLLVGQAANTSAGKPSTASSVLKLVFGALALALAVRQWRERPKPGETAELPKWMSTIDSFTFGKALGLGFLLSAVNPKEPADVPGRGHHHRRRAPVRRRGRGGSGGLHADRGEHGGHPGDRLPDGAQQDGRAAG